MGNCDTHLFLGSNSQKTVEYFSKALGEKTIFRESESVNKDREDWKQGKSVSDQKKYVGVGSAPPHSSA